MSLILNLDLSLMSFLLRKMKQIYWGTQNQWSAIPLKIIMNGAFSSHLLSDILLIGTGKKKLKNAGVSSFGMSPIRGLFGEVLRMNSFDSMITLSRGCSMLFRTVILKSVLPPSAQLLISL